MSQDVFVREENKKLKEDLSFMNTMNDRIRAVGAVTLLCSLLLSASCSKEPAPERTVPVSGGVRIDFTAGIAASAEPVGVRAAVEGNQFPVRDEAYNIGVWICEYESGDSPSQFSPLYTVDNMKISLTAGLDNSNQYKQTWKYLLSGQWVNMLFVSEGTTQFDAYAYYPHTTGAASFNPTSVPFRSGSTDWMWADRKQFTNVGHEISVPLQFSHAMTCLEVRVECKYASDTMVLNSITLSDSKSRLLLSGTMNLVDHTLNTEVVTPSGSLTLTPQVKLRADSAQVFHFIVPEVSNYENGDFTLSFKFNPNSIVKNGETTFSIPNTITSGGSDVTISSFETGKRYVYRLTLDNRLRFEPVGVDESWTTTNHTIEEEL